MARALVFTRRSIATLICDSTAKRYEGERALLLTMGDPSGDPRPRRMVSMLSSLGFAVDVVGQQPHLALPSERFFPLASPGRTSTRVLRKLVRLARLSNADFRSATAISRLASIGFGVQPIRERLADEDYRLIVVEDLELVPFGLQLRKSGKVVFDAREYYPLQNEESALWRILERPEREWLCRNFLPRCDHVITVSEGIADKYEREFAVRPTVVLSAPNYVCREPGATQPNRFRIVHHGAANPNRKLEAMVDVARALDSRFSVDFLLTGNPRYIDRLRSYAADVPSVRYLSPVPLTDLDATLSSYDIGIFFHEPSTFNLRYALPNKLFEFVQARLAVAIGPSPEMKRVVDRFECGIVSDDFSVGSMAERLNALTPAQLDRYKKNSATAAQVLNFETESLKLTNLFRRLLAHEQS